MGSERIDITGEAFDLLKVEGFAGTDDSGRATWLCRCACTNTRVCRGSELRSGRVRACRKCARDRMVMKFRRRPTRRPAVTSPDKLSPDLRARYEEWERRCRQLGLTVFPSEQAQVLRELSDARW